MIQGLLRQQTFSDDAPMSRHLPQMDIGNSKQIGAPLEGGGCMSPDLPTSDQLMALAHI